MTTTCKQCGRKTHQIDASIYAGDYHGFDHYGYGRQCVECGTVYEVGKMGSRGAVRYLGIVGVHRLPPRMKWEEPKV